MKSRFSIRDLTMLGGLVAIWVFFWLATDAFVAPRNLWNLSVELSVTATLALGMLLVLLLGMIDLSVGSGVGLVGGITCVLIIRQHWPAPLAMLAGLAAALLLWWAMGMLISGRRLPRSVIVAAGVAVAVIAGWGLHLRAGWPAPAAGALGLAAGAALTLLVARLNLGQKVPPFIITLGGLLIYRGVFWLVIRSETVPVAPGNQVNLMSVLTTYALPAWGGLALCGVATAGVVWAALASRRQRRAHGFEVEPWQLTFLKLFVAAQAMVLFTLVMNRHRGVPLAAVILGAVALFIHVVSTHTPFGRYLYAIGGNEEAAVLSGVPVEKVVIGAYMILGAIVALTGFMQTAYAGASTTTVGDLMELDAIAACVVGGTSLNGGRGSVLGVFLGALIMASLLNGMAQMAVSPEVKFIARGAVLAMAVWMDAALNRRRGR